MADWTLECLTVGPLQMNAWLLLDHEAGEAALIDPGDEAARLLARIDASGCRLRWLLATHGHFDHVAAAAEVQARWDLPLRIHPDDVFLVESMPDHQALYDLPQSAVPRLDPTLDDGELIPLGEGLIAVQRVPGHSPGQVMFVWDGHALVGDCIFAGSVGRTDLPGGDFGTLEQSIRRTIYALPDRTILHPGHGPDTTVGREKVANPYVPGV
ncbi:MAG: MBL fold metallo-hydrolase [Candidatus Krumholzibacteriia bacterium]